MRVIRGYLSAAAALLVGLSCLPPSSARPEESAAVDVKVGKYRIDFSVGKHLVTTYRFHPSQSKPYFYPLRPLPAVEVTENGPSDHVHHRSAWFCHGDVVPEGLELKEKIPGVAGVDFWSERKGAGKIVCTKVEPARVERDNGVAAVTTKNEWRTADGKKVLDETRAITFRHLGPNRNLIVLVSELHASAYPLEFADTKEGAMGIRIKDDVQVDSKKGGKITNAEGKENQAGCWGRTSAWCDYSGPIDGVVVGLAVFADPANKVDTAWHARDYGLLAANPFGRDKHAKFPDRKGNNETVKLKKGETLRLRYGLYLHAGDVKTGGVREAFEGFAAKK
jgi:hypothetical protein